MIGGATKAAVTVDVCGNIVIRVAPCSAELSVASQLACAGCCVMLQWCGVLFVRFDHGAACCDLHNPPLVH